MKQFCFQWLVSMLRPTLPNDSLEHQGHKPAKEPGGQEQQSTAQLRTARDGNGTAVGLSRKFR